MQSESATLVLGSGPSDRGEPERDTRTEESTRLDGAAAVSVPVSSLLPGDSPRVTGENTEHVRALAAAQGLPPIIVNRSTMRVIDGMHRLRAAKIRGDEAICVKFFDGDDKEAFLLAVNVNIKHGLPLSLADREAAASRILSTYPEWSDRAIASIAGLSATTVSSLRRRSVDQFEQSNTRIGIDGRVRPLNGAAGRRRASEVIAKNPDASLRDIAREAGISIATAQDVRKRLRAGRDPILPNRRGTTEVPGPSAGRLLQLPSRKTGNVAGGTDWRSVRANLSKDPAVKYAEIGRAFVRWFDGHVVDSVELDALVQAVPPHWRSVVAELARSCAGSWLEFALELERRARDAK